jgi:aspartyl-tRNA(Asn)/glutamyl-tRNA(Gln) amidotransferase subunit A
MAPPTEPWALDIATAAARMAAGELTPSVLLESVLGRIDAVEPMIRAYVLVDRDSARAEAALMDAELARGTPRGPLHGIPIAIKDIFDVAGHPTRCGSRAFEDVEPARQDSTAVARLRSAGALLVGKTHTHELALGDYTPQSRNPWALERSAGGSSGGSAAAVAAYAAMGATGSDTGGSIRAPASLCGLVGIKPTYGRVSRAGVAALAWSLDHVGPMARSVDDAALLLTAMAGADPRDPSASDRSLPDLLGRPRGRLDGVRIGVPRDGFFDGIQPAVSAAFAEARRVLERLGASVVDVALPEMHGAVVAEYVIVFAEGAAYHSELVRTRIDLLGGMEQEQLQLGALLSGTAYTRAQRIRARLARGFRRIFEEHRLAALLVPSTPATAQRHEQTVFDFDGRQEPCGDAFVRTTAPFNLAGLPVVALPMGRSPDGLPMGIQFVARPWDELTAVTLARAYEHAAGWRASWPMPSAIKDALSA